MLIAALARALVETAARAWRQDRPVREVRPELLRLAAWRASRSGMADVLLNPATGLPEQPAAVVGLLLEHISDALADAGDTDTVTDLLAAVFQRGNGAAFQRSAYRRSGRLPEVVSSAAAATAPSPNELQTTRNQPTVATRITADMDGQLMPCPRRVSRADPVVLARNDRHRSTSRGPDLPRVAAGWSTAPVRPSARR